MSDKKTVSSYEHWNEARKGLNLLLQLNPEKAENIMRALHYQVLECMEAQLAAYNRLNKGDSSVSDSMDREEENYCA